MSVFLAASKEQVNSLKLKDVDIEAVDLRLPTNEDGIVYIYSDVGGKVGYRMTSIDAFELFYFKENLLKYQRNKNRDSRAWKYMDYKLKNDREFSICVLEENEFGLFLINNFTNKVRRDEAVIEKWLQKNVEYDLIGSLWSLLAEDRMSVAYRMCKKYPEYEKRLSVRLRSETIDFGIVKYVESKNLFKELGKELEINKEAKSQFKI